MSTATDRRLTIPASRTWVLVVLEISKLTVSSIRVDSVELLVPAFGWAPGAFAGRLLATVTGDDSSESPVVAFSSTVWVERTT